MKESEIESRLVRGVKKLGGKAYKFVSPGNAGVPDRLIITKDGRCIFVELKTESGRLSEIQKARIREMRGLNAEVVVLRGRDDVEDFLDALKSPLACSLDLYIYQNEQRGDCR